MKEKPIYFVFLLVIFSTYSHAQTEPPPTAADIVSISQTGSINEKFRKNKEVSHTPTSNVYRYIRDLSSFLPKIDDMERRTKIMSWLSGSLNMGLQNFVGVYSDCFPYRTNIKDQRVKSDCQVEDLKNYVEQHSIEKALSVLRDVIDISGIGRRLKHVITPTDNIYDKEKLLSVKEHVHKIHSILKSAFEKSYSIPSITKKRRKLNQDTCDDKYISVHFCNDKLDELNNFYRPSQDIRDYKCFSDWDTTSEDNLYVGGKMKTLEGMQPQINDMERRLGIMQAIEPELTNAINQLLVASASEIDLKKGIFVRRLATGKMKKQPVMPYVNKWYLANKDKYDFKMDFSGKKGRSTLEMLNDIKVEMSCLENMIASSENHRRKLGAPRDNNGAWKWYSGDYKKVGPYNDTDWKEQGSTTIDIKDPSEIAIKMVEIHSMMPQITDMERRLGIMRSVDPLLEKIIIGLQKVVDVRGMGKK